MPKLDVRITTFTSKSTRSVRVYKLIRSETRYLTIIPRARMGSESIAHEAEDSETIRARGIIVLVKSN